MYSEFLQTLIYTANPKLDERDLPILFKISKGYKIPTYELLNRDLNTIVGTIICYNLPHFVAKHLLYNDELVTEVVYFDGKHFQNCVAGAIDNQEYINFHIEKINKLLDES